MELIEVARDVYVTDGPTRIGVIVDADRQAAIVDAGLDDGSGKKLKAVLDRHGFSLHAILITHAHADHFGAAAWLAKATGAKVYANKLEKPVIECPILEPMYLFGGANPPRELRTKFYLGSAVSVEGELTEMSSRWGLQLVDLSGHTPGQTGIAAGGVLFCADSFIGVSVLEKHGVPLNMDIGATLSSYSTLLSEQRDLFVPSHGDILGDLKETVSENRKRVLEINEFVEGLLGSPKSMEDIIAAVCDRFRVRVRDLGMFYLMNLAVASHVSYLMGQKRARVIYERNRQYVTGPPID